MFLFVDRLLCYIFLLRFFFLFFVCCCFFVLFCSLVRWFVVFVWFLFFFSYGSQSQLECMLAAGDNRGPIGITDMPDSRGVRQRGLQVEREYVVQQYRRPVRVPLRGRCAWRGGVTGRRG